MLVICWHPVIRRLKDRVIRISSRGYGIRAVIQILKTFESIAIILIVVSVSGGSIGRWHLKSNGYQRYWNIAVIHVRVVPLQDVDFLSSPTNGEHKHCDRYCDQKTAKTDQ